MKILVTGFNPFNNQNINPSLEVLNALENNYHDNQIYKLKLNVEYTNDGDKLINEIKNINPDVVLLLGEAGGRKNVTLEYMAVNMDSATIPDNKGELLLHNEIIKDGPLAYKSTLNIEKIIDDLKENKFSMSYHAGTYICNDIYYRALNYIYSNNLNIKCGFVHFPFLKEQTLEKYKGYYSLELSEMIEVLHKLIDSICE